jgi:hypothetical protein
MIDRLSAIARALTVISLLAAAGAQAQTAQSPTSSPADTAGSKSPAQATGQPDKPSGPQINTAEIVARANKSLGLADARALSRGSAPQSARARPAEPQSIVGRQRHEGDQTADGPFHARARPGRSVLS